MKKVIMFLLLAVIAVGVTSCGTDEELDERKSNIPRIIEVTRLIPEGFGVEDYQQGDILTSDNPFVAEVLENGEIRLNHIGKATIKHNKRTYIVTVVANHKYYEPFLNLGASKADVIEYEKRKLKSADDDELIYEGDGEYITGIDYIFDKNNKLCNVYLIFNHFEGLWDLVWKERLVERYAEVTKTDDSIIYINNPNMKGYYNNGAIIFSKYNN